MGNFANKYQILIIMKIKNLFITFALSAILASCITDINTKDINSNINIGTSLVAPIGNVHADMLYLLNFLDSTYISLDSANAICLLYEQNDIDLTVNLDTSFRRGEYLIDTLTLRTQPCFTEIFEQIPSNIEEIPLPSGSYKFGKTTKYNLNFNKNKPDEIIQVDSAVIYQANVDFIVMVEGIQLSEENPLVLSFHYPNLLDAEFDTKFEDIYITQNIFSMSETIYKFMAHFDELEEGNLIDLVIDFNLISTGTTTISRNAKLIFETEINLINAKEVYGFVWYKNPIDEGHFSYEIPQDVFENELLKNNKLLFSNPQLEITTKTNVGIPLRLRLENVYASKGDRIEKATFNGVDYAIEDLIIPEVPFDSATTTFTLNREYGSLHTLLSMLPEKINVDYKVTTPESTTNKSQFITLPLLAKLDVQAKVPLQFDPTTSFSYKDTLDADFSGLAENELLDMVDIDTISVFLDINSAIPANITLKLYYLDNLDQIITESDPITIQSALVNADGCVATPTQKTVTLHTTEEAIEDVLNTKKIIIEASLTGYDENSKIYFQSTNAIDIKVGAYLKAKASLSTSQIGTSN